MNKQERKKWLWEIGFDDEVAAVTYVDRKLMAPTPVYFQKLKITDVSQTAIRVVRRVDGRKIERKFSRVTGKESGASSHRYTVLEPMTDEVRNRILAQEMIRSINSSSVAFLEFVNGLRRSIFEKGKQLSVDEIADLSHLKKVADELQVLVEQCRKATEK